jgi:hypothetical protein
VLGEPLFEATVLDSTILGGATMRVFAASYTRLGSGEKPWSAPDGDVVDTLDVADLESEADHAYALLGARDGTQVALTGAAPNGTPVVDGGRNDRVEEHFTARLAGASAGIVRIQTSLPARVRVLVGGAETAILSIPPGDWNEARFPLPPAATHGSVAPIDVRLVSDTPLGIFHYWFVR